MSDIDHDLLCKAIEAQDLTPVLDAHFRPDYCEDEINEKVWRWVFRYNTEYGNCPTEAALRREFPSYDITPIPEPYSYLIDEMLRRRKFVIIHQGIEDIRQPLSERDADTALKTLAAAVDQANLDTASVQDEDLTDSESTRKRLERYLSARPGGLLGITTGFPSMDRVTSGLQKEQLITLVGPPKGLKTEVISYMNMSAHQAGYRTLFITFEMAMAEVSARQDALRAEVSHDRLRTGRLHLEERQRVQKTLRRMEAMPPMMYVHDPSSVTTVSALASKLAQYRPDAVYIDGAYLMDAEVPHVEPGSPQALTSITRSLKRLAQRCRVPIVVTTQALESKMRSRKVTLNSIGYTSSFAQDSDVIFGVEKGDDEGKEIVLKIVAARNTGLEDIRLFVDWEHGRIVEMESGSPDEEGDGEEVDYA